MPESFQSQLDQSNKVVVKIEWKLVIFAPWQLNANLRSLWLFIKIYSGNYILGYLNLNFDMVVGEGLIVSVLDKLSPPYRINIEELLLRIDK